MKHIRNSSAKNTAGKRFLYTAASTVPAISAITVRQESKTGIPDVMS